MASDRAAPAADPARDIALAEVARIHLGFGSLSRQDSDDRDFREVAVWQARAGLEAAYAAGLRAAKVRPAERAPDCTTERAAAIAGIFAEAVMAGEVSFAGKIGYDFVQRLPFIGDERGGQDYDMGLRTAMLMIEARARASVRTPDHAALSAASAALAVIEDALAGPAEGEDVPDLFAVAERARDLLRAVFPATF